MNYIIFENKGKNTVKTLLKKRHISNRSIKDLLDEGLLVNDRKVKRSINLNKGDRIKIKIPDESLDYEPIKGSLDIRYEAKNLLVVNKPSNLTVNSKGQESLANHLAFYFKKNDIRSKVRLINRLDMDTSGLMMVAKNKFSQAYYQKLIEENKIKKKYLAYVGGRLDINKLFKIKLSYDKENFLYRKDKSGKEALTHFKTVFSKKSYSLIECDIKTGKTHQIRASLKSLGHPILGDKLYGSDIGLSRFLLHSYYLSFDEFLSEESIIIKDLPDFEPFLKKL